MDRYPLDTLGQAKRAGLQLEAQCRNYLCRHRWPVDLDYVIAKVGAAHRLRAVRGVRHFSERLTCPTCGWVGVTIERGAVMRQTPMFSDMFMSVELWDNKNTQLEKIIARTSHLTVGWAAYRSAAEVYVKRRVQLLDGRRVMADSTLEIIDGDLRRWRSLEAKAEAARLKLIDDADED